MDRRISAHRRVGLFALLLALSLATAACAPITVTPAAPTESSPLATPSGSPATASAASTPAATALAGAQKPVFAGVVKHAGQPVPNARVELRPVGWASSRADAAASVQADGQGVFSLANPPVGDFSVIGFFPDGEMDAGGWPPVSIAPGQAIEGFVVPIERRLTLISPIAGATVAAQPTLTWSSSGEAAEYRVWVIDAGTTELMLDQTTPATSVQVPNSLKPGVYQWVVSGLNAGGDLVAAGEETFTVSGAGAPTASPGSEGSAGGDESAGLPPSCQPRAGVTDVYSDGAHGFCFLYPAGFEENAYDPGQVNVVGVVAGPVLDSSPDPVRATLLLEVVPASGADLSTAVASITSEFAGQPGIKITQKDFNLGGVPATFLQGVPGRGGSQDVVAVQNGLRYRLLFLPDPQQGFPQVAKDFQALFDAVTQSFTFLPPAVTESQGPMPRPGNMPRLPDRDRAFEGAREALAKQLGVDPLGVQRVEVTPTEWNDACLGVSTPGQMCAQVITPGWIVILEVGGRQYEAHTNQDGTQVRFVGLS